MLLDRLVGLQCCMVHLTDAVDCHTVACACTATNRSADTRWYGKGFVCSHGGGITSGKPELLDDCTDLCVNVTPMISSTSGRDEHTYRVSGRLTRSANSPLP
jgi:hypothetical protein